MSAISDYFRTALVIDDRVEPDYRPLEALGFTPSESMEDEPSPDLVPPPDEDETPVRPADLVRAFLDENIVCSVLEPHESDPNFVDLVLRGTRIADLLILDWLFFGDDRRTVEAITRIAEVEDNRLRVIVVFTGVLSLDDISVRLTHDAAFEKIDNYVLKRGNTIVLIFGKPGITLTGGEASRTAEYYSELPGMIRDDLEMLFKGLMPRFAFQGINELRNSAPQILATFNSDLDAGALVHRALLPESDDAGAQFVGLLVSEFEQALIQTRLEEEWHTESVKKFLEDKNLVVAPSDLAGLLKSSESIPQTLRKCEDLVLAQEAVALGLLQIGVQKIKPAHLEALVAAFGNEQQSNQAFASLMSTTGFGSKPPRLELGLVVQDSSGNYWLCIQPLCDSVRIRDRRAFPLMPLRLSAEGGKPDAMFRDKAGEFIAVNFEQHPHKLAMPEFEANEHGSVIAVGEALHWRFEGGEDNYQAIARLRMEIAFHAVHGFVSQASRIGVDVSEWMRQGMPR